MAPRTRPRWLILPSLPTTIGEALELVGHLLFERDDLVEQPGDLAVGAGKVLGQANGEVAAPEAAQRADELAAIEKIARGKGRSLIAPSRGPPARIRMQIPFSRALHSNKQAAVPTKKILNGNRAGVRRRHAAGINPP